MALFFIGTIYGRRSDGINGIIVKNTKEEYV